MTASGEFTEDILTRLRNVTERLDKVESRERRRDRLLMRHREWDIKLVSQLPAGIDPGDPPPLWIEDD